MQNVAEASSKAGSGLGSGLSLEVKLTFKKISGPDNGKSSQRLAYKNLVIAAIFLDSLGLAKAHLIPNENPGPKLFTRSGSRLKNLKPDPTQDPNKNILCVQSAFVGT